MWKFCKLWIYSLFRLFVPRRCAVCDSCLDDGEEAWCLRCDIDLPRTGYHLREDNPMERALWGKMPLGRASAYFYYRRKGDYARLLHLLKYHGRKDLGETIGRKMAAELALSGFFRGIDLLLPVPLHPNKQRRRGYNQSEYIARGISQVTGLPIDISSLVRNKDTESQTRKTAAQRQDNVAGIFSLRSSASLAGKHILLIDDVFTTGATVTACADALQAVEGLTVSVLTLACADD